MHKVDIDHEAGIHLVKNVDFQHDKASYSRVVKDSQSSYWSSETKSIKNSDRIEKLNNEEIPWIESTDGTRIKFAKYKTKHSSHSKNWSNDYTNTSTPKTVNLSGYQRKYKNINRDSQSEW